MIGIPEFTLELSTHSITEAALHEAFDTSNRFVILKPDTVQPIIGIIIAVGIGGFPIWSGRIDGIYARIKDIL